MAAKMSGKEWRIPRTFTIKNELAYILKARGKASHKGSASAALERILYEAVTPEELARARHSLRGAEAPPQAILDAMAADVARGRVEL